MFYQNFNLECLSFCQIWYRFNLKCNTVNEIVMIFVAITQHSYNYYTNFWCNNTNLLLFKLICNRKFLSINQFIFQMNNPVWV